MTRAQNGAGAPALGLLNLQGAAAAELVTGDTAALGPLFDAVRTSDATSPSCDVLFVYCALDWLGRVRNSSSSLREIIRDSGAKVVVVATEHSTFRYIAATKKDVGYGRANLVMTLRRRG